MGNTDGLGSTTGPDTSAAAAAPAPSDVFLPNTDDHAPPPPDDALPAYTGHTPVGERRQVLHTFDLRVGAAGAGAPWLTLSVPSWAARAQQPPLFVGAQAVAGTVRLSLPKPETLVAVEIAVRARGRTRCGRSGD
jgi:hypothetical protein